jgi:hypothetical protein
LFKENNPEGGTDLKTILLRNLSHITAAAKKSVTSNNFFNFAWEKTNVALQAREYAKAILSETDILVIIGYSFPTFNDEIDKELFTALKNSKSSFKIIYQDLNANKNIISQRFDIREDQIEIDNENLRQFILPLDNPKKEPEMTFHFPKQNRDMRL